MHASRTTRLKWILLTSSLVFLAFLLLAAFEENFTSEWSAHQRSYAALSLQKAAAEGKPAAESTVEIRQVYLEGLKRVDRCVTCHVAIDDPRFADAALPLTTHPGDILKHHPADKFGCTVCHQGQGRATVKKDAHGDSPHWPEPMLRGELIYTTCSRCHYENDLYGGQSDLYGQTRPVENITEGELASSLPHADIIARGKRLVVANGCLGCHSYRGRGGRLGPDITYVGDKNAHGFDFKHVPGERTVENWLYTHFKSPAAVVPNTVMPDLKLTDAQARDLAAYMLSLKRKSAPAAYTPLPQPVDETPTSGENLYRAYCSACHGADGVGAIVRDAAAAKFLERPRELLTPSLRNIDTLSIASDAYLVRIVAHGRPGTSMPAWQSDGGLSADEIRRIVEFIRGWEPRAADREVVSASRGDAAIGRSLYRANCTSCHGLNGEGGLIGVSLRSPTFLAIASDDLLAETILRGRPNTAMPSWRQFDNRDVSDLLAFLRSEQPVQSNRELVLAATARRPSPGADPAPAETASDGNRAACRRRRSRRAFGRDRHEALPQPLHGLPRGTGRRQDRTVVEQPIAVAGRVGRVPLRHVGARPPRHRDAGLAAADQRRRRRPHRGAPLVADGPEEGTAAGARVRGRTVRADAVRGRLRQLSRAAGRRSVGPAIEQRGVLGLGPR